MKEESENERSIKKLATKKQVEAALDLGNKNREKIKKLQMFDLSFLLVKVTLRVVRLPYT